MSWKFYGALIGKYRRKGLLVDTNVLMLLLVGSLDPKLVSAFKVTASQGFTEKDFALLANFVGNFEKIIATPHILAEVSNHADKLKGNDRQKMFIHLISAIEKLDEQFNSAKEVARSEAFAKFGLTDAAINALASKHFLVLTADFPLFGYLEKRGADAINFNHLRQLAWED